MYKLGRVGLLLLAFCVAGASGRASAQGKASSVKIRIDSILATYADPTSTPRRAATIKMDARLNSRGVADRLKLMFNYTNYHLMRHQEDNAALGDAVAFNLPGGHILHVSPLEIRGNVLMLDLVMFEGARLIMRMPMRILGDGMLMLVDARNASQYYITTISADYPQLQHEPAGANVDREPGAPIQAFPALVPAQ
jgi:hypothetical protein